jgi:hypothetical protein
MTPGRWVVLAIGVPAALALIGWTGFNLVTTVAKGSFPFSFAVPVDDHQVAVNLTAGNVILRQAPGISRAQLTGTVQYGLIRPGIVESSTATGTNINLTCSGINTNCTMNAALGIPARTAVTLWSNGGNIAASGFSNGVTLSADGGNITTTDLAGDLQIDTGGGDLSANGLTGSIAIGTEGGNINASNWTSTDNDFIRVDTGGGDLSVNELTGNSQVVAEGGNINLGEISSGTVNLDSGGGDVTLAFAQVPQDLTITAEGGNVTVSLPPGNTTYDLSLPDSQGGNVNYPTSLANPKSQHKITIDSGGGDINISQS